MRRDAKSWQGYVLEDYDHVDFAPGALVLDTGFGAGRQLAELAARGCRAIGIEVSWELGRRSAAEGHRVLLARGEALPFRAGSFDGVVCKVVLPYTDEERVIAEIARVLRPGAASELSVHGVGYYVRHLLLSRLPKRRIYALRTIANTWLYRTMRRRWSLGDTIYQSMSMLARYFGRNELGIVRLTYSRRFLALPVFVCIRVRKLGGAPVASSSVVPTAEVLG